jgi:hypothetical protein
MAEKGSIDPRQLDPVRVGLATATGAIPFGKVVKAGATGLSALRSGLLSGGTEAAREALTPGESFDPKAIGLTAGLGALTGAGGAKIGEMMGGRKTPTSGEIAEQAKAATDRTAQREARKAAVAAATPEARAAARAQAKTQAAADKEMLDVRDAAEKINAQRALDLKTSAQKASDEATRVSAAEALRTGTVPKTSYSETISGKTPEGVTKRATTKFEPADDAAKIIDINDPDAYDEVVAKATAPEAPPPPSSSPLGKMLGVKGEAPPAEFVTPETNPLGRRGATDRFNPDEWSDAESRPDPSYAPYAGDRQLGAAPVEDVGLQPTELNQARAQAASTGSPASPIGPEATAQGVAPIEQPAQPSSSLLKFFKSPSGAAGANYGAAKGAEAAGQIGSADEAYNALARERQALGQTTKPRSAAVQPEPASQVPTAAGGSEAPDTAASAVPDSIVPDVEAGSGGPTGDWVKDQSTLAETAAQDPSLKARLLRLAQQEKGAVTVPGVSSDIARRLVGGGIGAAVGAPIGSAISADDDPYGALKGALAGAGIGTGVAMADPGKRLQEVINYHNASLLASPTVMAKKFLGDTTGIAWEGLKQALPGPNQDLNYAKDLFGATPLAQPRVWGRRLLEGMREDPNTAADLGSEIRAAKDSPLGWVGRPLTAAGYATRKALEDVGAPDDVIGRITGLGKASTEAGRAWLNLQKFPGARILRPFARTGTHIAEGVRNIPNPLTGGKAFGGPAEDAARRGAIGGLQMALGAGSELYDESNEAAGDPTSNAVKGMRMASMGLQGVVPYAVGKAIMGVITQSTSADAAKDMINTIPGAHAVLPEQYPNESSNAYIDRIARNVLESMSPSPLSATPNIR